MYLAFLPKLLLLPIYHSGNGKPSQVHCTFVKQMLLVILCIKKIHVGYYERHTYNILQKELDSSVIVSKPGPVC